MKHQNKGCSKYHLCFLLLFFSFFQSYPNQNNIDISKDKKLPLEVSVELGIHKIYNINSVNETYQIEGYVIYSWHNENLEFETKEGFVEKKTYRNKAINELKNKVWIPTFEFINLQGSGDFKSIRLETYSNGTINYTTTFLGTFSSKMDFTKFPFDSQAFFISIESFNSSINQLIFKDVKFILKSKSVSSTFEDWEFIDKNISIYKNKYQLTNNDVNSEKTFFSRVTFEINAKRLSDYYLWRVLYPLLIIVLVSFCVFWIEDFRLQIGFGFMIMVIVVSLNFYSAFILPKLPYNTLIEYVITVGYLFLFLEIIALIINNRVKRNKKIKAKTPIIIYCRYLFPVFFSILMLMFFIVFIK